MSRVFPFFVEAALVTLELTALALVLGLVAAALAAGARMSRSAILRAIGTAYVSLFRGTPCLIQLFVLYFGGPQIGINLDPFAAGVIGLGLNIGAYMAESIRGAVVAVDRGQTEAARTIGFSRFQTLRKVVLPQAARLMIRPLGVNTVALLKGSALVSTISVVELTYTAQRFIGSTYKPFEIFGVAALLYMVMVYAVARLVDLLDQRFAIV
ncbi:polar amino acid ABC transporter inner membrane subunit [Mesorhizobium loti]|nr:polar amino acid ABC transporter inner membrane subunit [Mesorhizobium loti]